MSLGNLSLVLLASILVPEFVRGQEVSVRVDPIDPTVNSRIQDTDTPGAPFSGGTAAVTGAAMAEARSSGSSAPAQKRSAVSRSNQFPSMIGLSTWGPSSLSAAASPAASSVQGSAQNGSRWTKAAALRKLNGTITTAQAESARAILAREEFSAAQSVAQNAAVTDLQLRKLKQAAVRPTRLRITNPFQSKADSSTAALWGGDKSSAFALAQQQHESGMLLHFGFNARSERKKRRPRGAATSASSR
jgi:hypothetical protein